MNSSLKSSESKEIDEFSDMDNLERNVAEILPVFPLVCRQLSESITDVQNSVESVCGSFNAISEMTKSSVQRSSDLIDESGSQGKGVRPLIEAARSIIGRLLAQSEESHARQVEMANKIESVEHEVRSIKKIVDKIYSMSQSLKVLAINATIEASRAGAAGRTFAVVAGETKKVAASAGEMNSAIQSISNHLEDEIRSIAEGIRHRAESGHREVESARETANDTLSKLSIASDEMTIGIERASQEANKVTDLIRSAIISLQFQDNVSQRVGNAVGALREIESELAGCLSDFDPEAGIGVEWEKRLKGKFTMASEHRVLGHNIVSATGNVELF
jgi:methyl-accepting chemotaxis protein